MQAERTINSLKSITGNLTMDALEIGKKKKLKTFINWYTNQNVQKIEKFRTRFLTS